MNKANSKYLLALLLVGVHLWQASLVRPVADDYTLLRIYSQEGFFASVSYIWTNFGGNITPAFVRAVFISPSLEASNWYGFMAFSIFTSILVIASYLILISWLSDRRILELSINEVLIVLLASLAFEGLFTPGLSSAYLFGAAAGVHLWPICLFIISLKAIAITSELIPKFLFPIFSVVLILSGFTVGNSGFAESSAIFISLLVFNIWFLIKSRFLSHPKLLSSLNIYLLGITIGLVTIFLAPGFSSRNSRLGKINDGYAELAINFRSSLISFFGEVITHPIWLFAILVILLRRNPNKLNIFKSKLFLVFSTIVFVMLILGATFGYAAWHQSIGLIFLLAPVAFCSVFIVKQKGWLLSFTPSLMKYISLLIVSVVLVGLMFRGLVVQEVRSSNWDSNFLINLCSIVESRQLPLLGAEIKYWPIGLGVEDVNTWKWMALDYEKWLTSIRTDSSTICK